MVRPIKILFILLIISFALCSCQPEKSIGENQGSAYYLNSRVADSLTSAWNVMLANESILTTVTELSIVKEKDLDNNEDY